MNYYFNASRHENLNLDSITSTAKRRILPVAAGCGDFPLPMRHLISVFYVLRLGWSSFPILVCGERGNRSRNSMLQVPLWLWLWLFWQWSKRLPGDVPVNLRGG
jgi:hypothetical protein